MQVRGSGGRGGGGGGGQVGGGSGGGVGWGKGQVGGGKPEGASQDPGLLRNIGHFALDPHVATVLLHLAQECCQQGALACMQCILSQCRTSALHFTTTLLT